MAVLDAVPVDQIGERARQVDVGRVLLTLFAALFFAIGWLVGAVVNAVVWSVVAAKVGYEQARQRSQAAQLRPS